MSRFVFRAEGSRISDPKPDAGIHLNTLPFALKSSLTVDWKDRNLFIYGLMGLFKSPTAGFGFLNAA